TAGLRVGLTYQTSHAQTRSIRVTAQSRVAQTIGPGGHAARSPSARRGRPSRRRCGRDRWLPGGSPRCGAYRVVARGVAVKWWRVGSVKRWPAIPYGQWVNRWRAAAAVEVSWDLHT